MPTRRRQSSPLKGYEFNFQNHTGHVLSKRGLSDCLEAVLALIDTTKQEATVRNVQCINGDLIAVIVNRHGMAYKR